MGYAMKYSVWQRQRAGIQVESNRPQDFTMHIHPFTLSLDKRIERANKYEAELLSQKRPSLEREARAGVPYIVRVCYLIHPSLNTEGRSNWLLPGSLYFRVIAKQKLKGLRVHRAWAVISYMDNKYSENFNDLLLAQAHVRAIQQTRALMILRDEI
ncbi:MAG: hypothetical protein HC794_01155 [Nitrospiraceae bacterium]|nr:hypothetical protein [Nitrospiraceae bacterium]